MWRRTQGAGIGKDWEDDLVTCDELDLRGMTECVQEKKKCCEANGEKRRGAVLGGEEGPLCEATVEKGQMEYVWELSTWDL